VSADDVPPKWLGFGTARASDAMAATEGASLSHRCGPCDPQQALHFLRPSGGVVCGCRTHAHACLCVRVAVGASVTGMPMGRGACVWVETIFFGDIPSQIH
jgi:hypothetical protein